MNEYIKREDAHALLCQFCRGAEICVHDGACNAEKALANIPTADVVERKVGRWEKRMNIDVLIWCSECGWMKHQGDNRRYNYCPNCGADMRGDE